MAKNYNIIWAKTANEDLIEIIQFIKFDSPNAAKNILNKIKKTASSLDSFPQRGRVVPELKEQGIFQYQELIIQSWRMIYRVSSSTVYVLSIIDARRNVEDVLLNRFIRDGNK
ncbi:type II toxin-antitoxin system RelE/ParE family toxin [Methyloprofundus sp.]|uniref:type II toxin-antitoxin system RelE/ParE family toxin n=1 Tax=Methyloprofundus sp. TaxID=2020875 RepID=UPI003D0EC7FC